MSKLLPIYAMEKILKSQGAKRVSMPAKKELKQVLEEIAEDVAKNAVEFAEHTGRRTVLAKDVKIAIKK